jgi:hypothetical protein
VFIKWFLGIAVTKSSRRAVVRNCSGSEEKCLGVSEEEKVVRTGSEEQQ